MVRPLAFMRAALLVATLSLMSARTAYAQKGAASGASAAPPWVWVHLDGPEGLRLQLKPDYRSDVEESLGVCIAPCDRWVPSTAWYYLTAPGRRDSKTFSLDAVPGQRETMHARGGSVGLYVLGTVGLSIGIAIGATGGLVLWSYAFIEIVSLGQVDFEASWGWLAVSGGMLVAGLALAIVGYVARDGNAQMQVTQVGSGQADPAAPAASVRLLPDSTVLSRDSKTSAASAETERFPAAIGVPLLSATF